MLDLNCEFWLTKINEERTTEHADDETNSNLKLITSRNIALRRKIKTPVVYSQTSFMSVFEPATQKYSSICYKLKFYFKISILLKFVSL